jgi:tRNA G26 N,N-dimethylase Trm1
MVYAEQQRRERYVSVFDAAAAVAVRAARYFREAARRAKQARAVEVAKRPQKDARKQLRAQAPPRASEVRMRDDVEALRVQRLL